MPECDACYQVLIAHKLKRSTHYHQKMLTSLLIIPILGMLALSPMQDGTAAERSRMKQVALLVTLINFVVSLVM